MTDAGRVVIFRGDLEESSHRVHAVVSFGKGAGRTFGRPDYPVFVRSAIKPIQATAVLDGGAFDAFAHEPEEIALACASHGGEPEHVSVARRALARVEATEADLICGPHEPMHVPAARALAAAGRQAGRLHNNCSGKHAAMIALARHLGAPTAGYHESGHPVQVRVAEALREWTGRMDATDEVAIDGCGIPTYRFPLASVALAFARWGAAEGGPARIRAAVASHPDMIAGTDRLCTAIARASEGAILAKVGAEGVYAACVPAAGAGLALKVEDGSRRAGEAALAALLLGMGLADAATEATLAGVARGPVENTLGDTVGAIVAGFAGLGSRP